MAVNNRYFNKIIDIELLDTNNQIKSRIMTPRKGVKPQIEITGNLISNDFVSMFEVRITNLYIDENVSYTALRVYAGYEGQKNIAIEGTISNIYTETPGPDKVTVFMCTQANIDAWNSKTVKLDFDKQFTAKDAVEQIATALGFSAFIAAGVISPSKAPWNFNGLARSAVAELRGLFPEVNIFIMNNTVFLYPGNYSIAKTYALPFLKSPAQFTGGGVSLVTVWDPAIKPNDFVTFPVNAYTKVIGALTSNKVKVISIAFAFDTAGDTNEMQITGALHA